MLSQIYIDVKKDYENIKKKHNIKEEKVDFRKIKNDLGYVDDD